MKHPHTLQWFPSPEHVFITQKAEKEQQQRRVVTSQAVKDRNCLLIDKDDNTNPVPSADVDGEKQSVFFENVAVVLGVGRKVFVQMSVACQHGGEKDTKKKGVKCLYRRRSRLGWHQMTRANCECCAMPSAGTDPFVPS